MCWSSELYIKREQCTRQQITSWQIWLLVTVSPFCWLHSTSILICSATNLTVSETSLASFLTYISVAATSFTLTLLAIERYHALLKPFRTGLRLKKDNVKKAIIIIWIASILLCSPEFFIQEWSETFSTCVGVWSFHINQTTRVLMIRFCIFTSYIPLAIFLYCYGSLIKGLYFTNTICSANSTEEDRSNKKKLVVTFMMATAGFVICYLPIQVFYTFVALGGDKHISFKLHSTLSALVTFIFDCSLCFNPILYAFRSTSFRDGFKHIMLCRRTPSE